MKTALLAIKRSKTFPCKFSYKNFVRMNSSIVNISINPSKYPIVRREPIVENFQNIKVTDNYRWLENPDSKETKAFVDQLNTISEPFLKASEVREKLTEKLTKLWNYEKYGCTSSHGNYYYYYYNSGLENQWVLYQQKNWDEKGEIFVDPNKFSEDGTTSINQQSWSEDGSIFAYGISEKGSDWVTLKFKKCTGEDLPDVITGVKHSHLTWISTNEGVFYSRYPEHKGQITGSSTEKHMFHSLFYHKLGTDSKNDVLVADFRENEDFIISGSVSEDGRFLIVDLRKGCQPKNSLYYFDLEKVDHKVEGRLDLKPLFVKFDAKYDVIDNDGDKTALIYTNYNSPMFKLIRINLQISEQNPENWETIIPEDPKRKLDWVVPVATDKLLVAYVEDVKTKLYVYDLKKGKQLHELKIPVEISSLGSFYGRKKKTEVFFTFESFFVPTIVFRADFKDFSKNKELKIEEIRHTKIPGLDSSAFEVEQVFYPSKDGTNIPMYILCNKNFIFDGNSPTLLNGYGGFNIDMLPSFSISRLLFIQNFNAVVAIANLRGGSEYGEKWHEAGMRENKQNVFDDFIAAAEYLIQKQYTNPKKLAIQGGSNGGLLVAACSQQRPDLFGAVLNRVGVLDMLRFHKFTIGGAWISEYGNPDSEDVNFIYKYSPLHNLSLQKGIQWPATLLMSADHDDRVVPLHTLKYMAQLYYLLNSEASDLQRNPVLARIEVNAGHGSGKPTDKVIADIVDMYCFLQRVLNMQWKD